MALTILSSLPAQAHLKPPASIKAAQQELLRLAAPQVEMYDKEIATGVFMAQQITFPTACSMTMTRRWPAHRYGGVNYQAGSEAIEIYHFEQGFSVSSKFPYVVRINATPRNARPAKTFATRSATDAKRATEIFDWLGRNCKNLGDRNNHTPVGKVMKCTLNALPDLVIEDSGPVVFGYASPSIGESGSGNFLIRFLKLPNMRPNYGSLTVLPQFSIPKADAPKTATRYIAYIDGREFMGRLGTEEKSGILMAVPAFKDQLPFYRALARGKSVTVRAFDSRPSQVGIWTFDISGASKLDRVVANTVRRC